MGSRGGLLAVAVFFIATVLSAFAGTVGTNGRVALVIGNGAYKNVPVLPNPPNDAEDVAAALERLGFAVHKVTNARFEDLRRALLDFNSRASGAELAVVFYAGHGISVGGENYLIPVDAELSTDAGIGNEAVNLHAVMMAVSGASELGLVILDACRNNPFANRMQRLDASRAVGRGLAPVQSANNVLVAFAAKDGATAADGAGRNSPFSAALLKFIETPGLEINFLFRDVRDEVMAATKREQQPFVYGSLSKKAIYLKPSPSMDQVSPLQTSAGESNTTTTSEDESVWLTIVDSSDPSLFEEFLRKFPISRHVGEARSSLQRLRIANAVSGQSSPETKRGPPATGSALRLDLVTDCDRLAASPSDSQRPDGVAGIGIANIDVGRASSACDDAMRRYSGLARLPFEAGRVALAAKDYGRAQHLLESAATLGSDSAMVDIGLLFESDRMGSPNFDQARHWYEKAADLGNSLAMFGLGELYEHGRGVGRDDTEARRWYERAAAAGNSRAMNQLGEFHQRGRGIPQDYAKARDWYEKAAKLGSEIAMRNLGALYEHGLGVHKNTAEAHRWYESAAASGDEQARMALQRLGNN
jgi:uncharacterized protein